ncbi:hypothetical protein [Mucilaginibacter agri]|uniref:PKD-like domain-containing protein n=1 Tax=Mucilaginibacter agri TaxID=2695265 RepID=A0A966DSZ3_9SPHI|nr:hypothetical protein [Mucilaginibacter agri]NCD68229.1 hypothetical protein [Mucilaginibacter agri]
MSIQLKDALAPGVEVSKEAVSDENRINAVNSKKNSFNRVALKMLPVLVLGITAAMAAPKPIVDTRNSLHATTKVVATGRKLFSLPSPGTIYIDGNAASNGFEMQRLTEYTVSVNEVPGATSYVWSVGNNAIIDYGQGTNVIHVITGSYVGQSLSFSVQAVDGTGPGAGSEISGTLVGF